MYSIATLVFNLDIGTLKDYSAVCTGALIPVLKIVLNCFDRLRYNDITISNKREP